MSPEVNLDTFHTESPSPDFEHQETIFEEEKLDVEAKKEDEKIGPIESQNEAFPETEFNKFRKEKAGILLLDWLTNSHFQKFTSAFYLLWDNIQHAKLNRLLQNVEQQKLNKIKNCFEIIKQMKKKSNKNSTPAKNLSFGKIQKRLQTFKKNKFKFEKFDLKYKTNKTNSERWSISRTSIDRKLTLGSMLRKQTRKSHLGWNQSKKIQGNQTFWVKNKTIQNNKTRKLKLRIQMQSNRTIHVDSPQRQPGFAQKLTSAESEKNQLNQIKLSSFRNFRFSKDRKSEENNFSFIVNSFVDIQKSNYDFGLLPHEKNSNQKFNKLSQLFGKIALKNQNIGFIKLRENLESWNCSFEEIEAEDLSSQMNKIADFSKTITTKCKKLEQKNSSFSRDKGKLMHEIDKLLFYVKNDLLGFEQPNKPRKQKRSPFESPLMSELDSELEKKGFLNLFKKKTEEQIKLSRLPSTRNSSAINYPQNNFQMGSPWNVNSDSLASLRVLKGDFWESVDKHCQVNSPGLSGKSEDNVNFDLETVRISEKSSPNKTN